MVIRAIIFVAVAFASSAAHAGELFDSQSEAYWNNIETSATGEKVGFSQILHIGGILYNGATIAYVDLFGSGSSLTLYKSSVEPGGISDPFHGNGTWIYPVAVDDTPEPIDQGWTRFDFRDQGLLVKFDGGPTFQGGGGPLFGVSNGEFSAVAGQEQIPMQTGSVFYTNMPFSGIYPSGPIPIFRVIWESLDAPYTAENGDANQDGRVDLTDFGILKSAFGQEVGFRLVADFNGDSFVTFADFERLKENFGWQAAAAVPEPNASLLALAGIATLAILRLSAVRLPQARRTQVPRVTWNRLPV